MKKLKAFSISLVVSFIVATIFLFISSAIFAYTNMNDRHLESFVLAAITISVLVGSTLLSRKIKEKGMILGALFGALYCIIIYLFNVIAFSGFFFTNTLAIYLAICVLSGIIGGVIGVNI